MEKTMEEQFFDTTLSSLLTVPKSSFFAIVEVWGSRRECPETQSKWFTYKAHPPCFSNQWQFSRLRWRCPHHHNVASLRSDTGCVLLSTGWFNDDGMMYVLFLFVLMTCFILNSLQHFCSSISMRLKQLQDSVLSQSQWDGEISITNDRWSIFC